MSTPSRRGWRETVEPGIYRAHRVACPSSGEGRPGRRCECPWQIAVPGADARSTRLVQVLGTRSDARRERDLLRALGRPRLAAPGTLHELARDYFRARAGILAPSTLRGLDTAYRLRVAPALGHLALADLDRARVEGWLSAVVARASSRHMVLAAVTALRQICAAGVEWERLPSNPARRLRLPAPEPDRRPRVLTRAQLGQLLDRGSDKPRIRTMLRAAGEGGLRKGEIVGLRWPDVDLAGRRLHVRRAVWQDRGGVLVVKTTKGRRERRVAISADYASAIADWYALSVVEGGAAADGYVWPSRAGGPMGDGTLAQALRRACARAELLDPDGRALVSPHGLRHTAASVMLGAGVPLIVVSRQLGHADPQITASVYAHLLADEQLDAAAAAFAPPAEAPLLREKLRGAPA